jgi:hypothetical protein
MRHAEVTLDDKFLLTEGRDFVTACRRVVARVLRAVAGWRCAAPSILCAGLNQP